MKPTTTILLLALLLTACGPMRDLQKVQTRIPCLGSVGKSNATLLTKDFQKAGEPTLNTPLEVSLNSFDFSNATLAKYKKYKETQGETLQTSSGDSTKQESRKYFQLRLIDLVGLKGQLNLPQNQTLKEYLRDDMDLTVLTGISFVVQGEAEDELGTANHFYLKELRGNLILEAHKSNQHTQIAMTELEVFDFETSQLCWKRNSRGRLEIAAITNSGSRCPGETEKNPNKLNTTKTYLKL